MFASLRKSIGLSPTRSDVAAATSTTPSSSNEYDDVNVVYGYLVLENSKGVETARYPLQKRITTFGRLLVSDIRMWEPSISRLHCQICVYENGKIYLEIFNTKGIKVNGRKVEMIATASESRNLYPLQESDVVEILKNRFRLEHVQKDEQGRIIIPKNIKLGRKALRMSLVRAEIVGANSSNSLGESQAIMKEIELQSNGKEEVNGKALLFQEDDKENAPLKSRRSFIVSTPSRQLTQKGPWESEPRKKKVKSLNLSPVKGSFFNKASVSNTTPINQSTALVVMEEVDGEGQEDPNDVAEMAKVESQPAQLNPTIAAPATPPKQDNSSKRLTKSSSPKKARRRSSFFGRAGLFAGLNLGFYPEERQNSKKEEAVEGDLKEVESKSTSVSPEKVLPEPRLDYYGMPRLPRSMSSPSGLNYGSPGKRRVISLRTATLMKNGQQVFEQRKLLSPPPSPTKTVSSPTLFLFPSPAKKAAAGQLALPESDADDADEVDKSLSSFGEDNDDEEEGEELKAIPQPVFTVDTASRRPRRSHVIPSPQLVDTKVKSRGKARLSLPGTLLSVSLVETSDREALEEWRQQWESANHDNVESRDKEYSSLESSLHNAFDKVQEEETDEEELEVEDDQVQSASEVDLEAHEPFSKMTSPVKMLRQMVQDSPDLTALLDEITGEGADEEAIIEGAEVMPLEELPVTVEKEARIPLIPRQLSATPAKLSRRVSEQPQRKSRRRSSDTPRRVMSKPRKSADAVLKSSLPCQQMESISSTEAGESETGEENLLSEPAVEEVVPIQIAEAEQFKVSVDQAQEKEQKDVVETVPLQEIINSTTSVERLPGNKLAKTKLPVATRRTRAAKVAAVAAINGEGVNLKERQASESPKKRATSNSTAFKREATSVVTSDVLFSDDQQSSHLILEPSSPIKRVKRAAKNKAEAKIKEVLTKKPSITVMRDARTLSEASASKSKVQSVDESKKSNIRSTRLPRKASQAYIQSEPSRTTRSRTARQQ